MRILREVKLFEVSPVTFAANEDAVILRVKALLGLTAPERKATPPFADLPLAERDRPWDADAAVQRVRRWAGGPDNETIDWREYRMAFFWYDEESPDNFTSYKLPFADVIDGELRAVPRGIFAAAAALMGARGGVDLPPEDVEPVKRHVARYYAKMREEFDDPGIVPPWMREAGLTIVSPEFLSAVLSTSRHFLKEGRVFSEANRRLVEAAVEALLAAAEPGKRRSTRDGGEDASESTETPRPAGPDPEEIQSVLRELRQLRETIAALRHR